MSRLGACVHCGRPVLRKDAGLGGWTGPPGAASHLDCAHEAWLVAGALRGLDQATKGRERA